MKRNTKLQLKERTNEPQKNEQKVTQLKTPQLKVQTGIRSGMCVLDDYCGQWVCC